MTSIGTGDGLVSIIIPTFDRRQLVAETIHSCFEQTYSNIEVIVIDDGSSDGTPEFLEKIARQVSRERFRYLVKSNEGGCIARNSGLEIARGFYVKFMDSDDTLEHDAVEHFVSMMRQSGADLCIGARRYMSPEGKKWRVNYRPPGGLVDTPLIKFFDLEIRPQQGMWMFRKALFDEGLRWDRGLLARQDTDLLGRALVLGAKVAGAPEAVLNQRYHAGVRQSFRQFEPAILESIYQSNCRLYDLMRERNCPQKTVDAFARSLCRTSLRAWEHGRRELAWKFFALAKRASRRPQLVLLETYPRRTRTLAKVLWSIGGLQLCGPLLRLYRRVTKAATG